MADLVNVTDNSFDAEVMKCDIPVLTEFMADWATACQTVASHLAEIAAEYADQLKIVKLDIKANPIVTANYEVLKVPTLILFKNGQEVERMSGVLAKTEMLDRIIPFLDA